MNILFIGGSSDYEEAQRALAHFSDFLKLSADQIQASVKALFADQIIIKVSNHGISLYDSSNLEELKPDVIFIRDEKIRLKVGLANLISRFCAHKNIPCVNDYTNHYVGSKIAQQIRFFEYQAPMLTTLYSHDSNNLPDAAESEFGYPYILKNNLGSHGNSNYLVKDRSEAEKVLTGEPNVGFIAQEYCPNDRDYRLLLVGDASITFERRGGPGTHLNNTSKGGSAELADGALPEEYIEKAKQVAASFGMKLSGVDIMPKLNTDEYYFLEINSQPQMVSGALLPEKQELMTKFLSSLSS